MFSCRQFHLFFTQISVIARFVRVKQIIQLNTCVWCFRVGHQEFVRWHWTVPFWVAKFNWGVEDDRWAYSLTWYTCHSVPLFIFRVIHQGVFFTDLGIWYKTSIFWLFFFLSFLQVFLFCTYIVLYILYMMTSVASNQARGTRDKLLPTTTHTTQPQKQIQVGLQQTRFRGWQNCITQIYESFELVMKLGYLKRKIQRCR